MNRCYVKSPLDERLAKMILIRAPHMHGWTPRMIALIRGEYDASLAKNGGELVKSDEYPEGASALWSLDIGVGDQAFTKEHIANFQKIMQTLAPFRREIRLKQVESIKHLHDNKADIWTTVSEHYDDMELFYNRASQLSHYFISALDEYIDNIEKKYNKKYTRQDVLTKGVYLNSAAGPVLDMNSDMLFTLVYNRFLDDFNARMNDPEITGATRARMEKEYTKLLNPDVWGALTIISKSMLKNLEGIKVSTLDNSVENTDIDTFGDNDIASLFDAEESTREGWQVITDALSAYGSLSKEVRRLLSSVELRSPVITYKFINGERKAIFKTDEHGNKIFVTKTDDLGYPVRMSSALVHKELRSLLGKCRTKKSMMRKLARDPRYGGLYETLAKDKYLQTQLFNDFSKSFQFYAQMLYKEGKKIIFQILNKTNAENYVNNYFFGAKYNPAIDSIAHSSKINWTTKDKQRLRNALSAFRSENGVNTFWGTTKEEDRYYYLENLFDTLGVTVTRNTMLSLLANKKKLSEMTITLNKLYDYCTHEDLNNDLVYRKNFMDWVNFISDDERSKGKKEGEVHSKFSTILTILKECGEGISYEDRCRTINAKGQPITYYSYVQPSYMGDLLGSINAFADPSTKEEDRAEIRKEYQEFLKSTFLKSSQFAEMINGKLVIRNKWVRSLWEEASGENAKFNKEHAKEIKEGAVAAKKDMFDSDSFTANFNFTRVVTSKENSSVVPFEDFTTKRHYEQLVSTYFSHDASKESMGSRVRVPVFVLGDSGVCKVLDVERIDDESSYEKVNGRRVYNGDKVIKELHQLYISELKRMSLFEQFDNETKNNGVKGNSQISKTKNRFTMLGFLNKYLDANGNLVIDGKAYSKEAFTATSGAFYDMFHKIASDYLDTKAREFIAKGEKLEVLDKKHIGSFAYVNKITKESKADIKERMRELYYNVYLSNLLQFQMFTGDTGYYKSVKDFQKRYKEIHAPGNTLDVNAVDKWAPKNADGSDVLVSAQRRGNNKKAYGKERVKYFKDLTANGENTNRGLMEVVLRVHAQASEAEVEQAIRDNIVVPLEDEKEESKRIAKLKKLLGSGYGIYNKFVNKTSRTDGQAYRYIDSYREIEIMAGTWDDSKEALFREIDKINEAVLREDRNILPDELDRIAEFNRIINPMKPYLFGKEVIDLEGGDALYIPVQHKYAEEILIPCLLPKGSQLREVAKWMKDNCDLLASTECVKVGVWGEAEMLKETNGVVDIASNLSEGQMHYLDYSDYRIQSNVPAHINVERALGTQVRKLIMGNINMKGKIYDYLGRDAAGNPIKFKITGEEEEGLELSGHNLISLYTSLIVSNMLESFNRFKKTVSDETQLSNLLTSTIVNNDRYSLHQLLDIAVHEEEYMNGTRKVFNTPLYEGAIEHDTTALIFSMFRKQVNKQDIRGGSLVQVSDWGITNMEEVDAEEYKSVNNQIKNYEKFEKALSQLESRETVTGVELTNLVENNLDYLIDRGLEDVESLGIEGDREYSAKEVEKLFENYQVSDNYRSSLATRRASMERSDLQFITDGENKNVIYAEIEIPFDFEVERFNAEGKRIKVKLDYNHYCNEDGSFILTGRKIDMANHRVLTTKAEIDEAKRKGTLVDETLIEKDYPGILDIVAYRIPSERDYSMINCRVKRCVEKTSGGTIRVPAQGTTIAGFDFDIDKLYVIRKDFRMLRKDITEQFTNTEKEEIFAIVYKLDALEEKEDFEEFLDVLGIEADAKGNRKIDLASLQQVYSDKIGSETIKGILEKIRKREGDKKGDYTIRRDKDGHRYRWYTKSLASHWNIMLEEHPEFKDDERYDKNKLFEKALEIAIAKGIVKEREIKYEEYLDEYDLNAGVNANSRTARSNMIFDLMRHRLMDQETLKDRLTPGGFDNSSAAAASLRYLFFGNEEQIDKLRVNGKIDINKLTDMGKAIMDPDNAQQDLEPEYDPADPNTLLYYNQLNQIAAKLIGVFANQNTNHQLSSIVKKLELQEPILFDGMLGNESSKASILNSAEDYTGLNGAELVNKIGSTLLAKSIRMADGTIVDVDLNLAEFLAASVDAVKDPVLNYLNFNTTTAAAGALLARLGYSTRDIGLLFNQPIIKDVCDIIMNSNGSVQFNGAKYRVLEKYLPGENVDRAGIYQKIDKGDPAKGLAAVKLTSSRLAEGIVTQKAAERNNTEGGLMADSNFVHTQIAALKIFEQAFNSSRELNQFINTTKFTAANSVGPSMGFFFNQQAKIAQYLNQEESNLVMTIYDSIQDGNPIQVDKSIDDETPEGLVSNRADYIKRCKSNPFAFEQCMYDLNKELIRTLDKYYPYNKGLYSGKRAAVSAFLSSNAVLDAETIDSIHRDNGGFILGYADGSAFDGTALWEGNKKESINEEDSSIVEGTKYTNREYYLYHFPLELFELKKAGKLPKYLEKYLSFAYSDYRDAFSDSNSTVNKQLHVSVNLAMEAGDRNSFMDAWANLAIKALETRKMPEELLKRAERLQEENRLDKEISDNEIRNTIIDYYKAVEEKESRRARQELGFDEEKLNNANDKVAAYLDSKVPVSESDAEFARKLITARREANLRDAAKLVEKANNDDFSHASIEEKIAVGLFYHNYYKTGFNVGPFSFMQFVPLEVKQLLTVGETPYLEYIGLDNLSRLNGTRAGFDVTASDKEFAYQYVLNHLDNRSLYLNLSQEGRAIKYFQDGRLTVETTGVLDLNALSRNKKTVKELVELGVETISIDGTPVGYKVRPVVRVGNYIFLATDIHGNRIDMIDNMEQAQIVYTRFINVKKDGEMVKLPIKALGKNNVSSTYARTLEEALLEKSKAAKHLAEAEARMDQEDRTNLIEWLSYQETNELDELEMPQPVARATEEITDLDIDKLEQRLLDCAQINEDFLLSYFMKMVETTDSYQLGLQLELDTADRNKNSYGIFFEEPTGDDLFTDEEIEAAYKDQVKNNVIQRFMSMTKKVNESRSDGSEVSLKRVMVNNLIKNLKQLIQSGNKEVYTQLTKEQIC